jgi:hypothetical protein
MKHNLGGIPGSREPSLVPQSRPIGFDPGRDDNGCPYALTDERSIERAMAWHEGYCAALRWMMESTQ